MLTSSRRPHWMFVKVFEMPSSKMPKPSLEPEKTAADRVVAGRLREEEAVFAISVSTIEEKLTPHFSLKLKSYSPVKGGIILLNEVVLFGRFNDHPDIIPKRPYIGESASKPSDLVNPNTLPETDARVVDD